MLQTDRGLGKKIGLHRIQAGNPRRSRNAGVLNVAGSCHHCTWQAQALAGQCLCGTRAGVESIQGGCVKREVSQSRHRKYYSTNHATVHATESHQQPHTHTYTPGCGAACYESFKCSGWLPGVPGLRAPMPCWHHSWQLPSEALLVRRQAFCFSFSYSSRVST